MFIVRKIKVFLTKLGNENKIKTLLINIVMMFLYILIALLLVFILCNLYNWIYDWMINEFKIKAKFLYLFGGINIKNQLALPFFIGIIGSFSTALILLLKGQTNVKIGLFKGSFESLNWCLAVLASCILGGIAGVGAVNILNSDGTVTEVLVISLVAGLSGVTYLKGIALMNGTEEDEIFKAREELVDTGRDFLETGMIPDNEILKIWEEYINTWINYHVKMYKQDNPSCTDEQLNAYIIGLEDEIEKIWKGDELDD